MEVSDRDRTAIRLAIEQQLQAFQQDDAKEAFSFASPGIQAQFYLPEKFMQMVKTAYPAIYRPRSVLFADLTVVRGNITQSVLLLAQDGTLVKALYVMEKQPSDTWKVNGCYLVPAVKES